MEKLPESQPKKSRRYTAAPQKVSESVLLGVFELPHGAGRPETRSDRTLKAESSEPEKTEPKSHGEQTPASVPQAPILSERAAEDDPRRWGDDEDDLGEWMKSQRPPHWD